MAYITKRVSGGALTDIYDDATKFKVGERVLDDSGNEYIFLKGVGSTVAGSWVTYEEDGTTTLLAANAIAPVAIAMAAIVANKYGFYGIWGTFSAKVSTGFADNGNLYATATGGEADDAIVAGDRVKNAIGRSAISGGKATVQINHPYMDDGLAA